MKIADRGSYESVITKMFYLYVCGANRFEAVLESDKPEGPFINARPIIDANGDSIDPAVFVDDDGQAYYFWGSFV